MNRTGHTFANRENTINQINHCLRKGFDHKVRLLLIFQQNIGHLMHHVL